MPSFLFHSKCENLNIINLSFTNDMLLFTRGDTISIKLLMDVFNGLFQSIGFAMNPFKCKAYFGDVEDATFNV